MPGQVRLDQDRLLVDIEEVTDHRNQLGPIGTEAPGGDALARPFEGRLGKERERQGHVPGIGAGIGDDERGGRYAMIRQHLLGPALMQGQAQGERIGGVVGNAEELTDRRDMSLPVHPVKTFSDIEDEIRASRHHLPREIGVGLEPNDLAQAGERLFDRIDRFRLVPFRVEIRLGEIGAKQPSRELGRRRWRCWGNWRRGSGSFNARSGRLEIECEPYSDRQKFSLQRVSWCLVRLRTTKVRNMRSSHNTFFRFGSIKIEVRH